MAGQAPKSFRVRLATMADAEAILAIYAPLVSHSAVSFETEPPSVTEMAGRIERTLPEFPWLVAEGGGVVLGYAYASRYRPRVAYQWAVECSVYVHPDARRQGIAGALYKALFAILKLQGFYKVYAAVTLPNPGSVAVHETFGFRQFATYQAVGYKLGAWQDVGWWEMDLRELSGEPVAPKPFNQLAKSNELAEILSATS